MTEVSLMQASFAETSFKGETRICKEVCPYRSNKQKNVKMEAIYMHVLERNPICLTREALQLISVSHRQNHSGYNSANLNDTPVMTTSTQNIPLSTLFSLYDICSKPGMKSTYMVMR